MIHAEHDRQVLKCLIGCTFIPKYCSQVLDIHVLVDMGVLLYFALDKRLVRTLTYFLRHDE